MLRRRDLELPLAMGLGAALAVQAVRSWHELPVQAAPRATQPPNVILMAAPAWAAPLNAVDAAASPVVPTPSPVALQVPRWEEDVLPTRLPLPTEPGPPTLEPTPAPTWPGVSALRGRKWEGGVVRAAPARDRRNAATVLDPASLPESLAGIHFAAPGMSASALRTGVEPEDPLNAPETAWSVEVVYTSDHRFDALESARLMDLHAKGFRIILRVDYERKQPIPPADDPVAVRRYVDTFLRYHRLTQGAVRYFILGNELNLDEPGDDPGRVTECLMGRHTCSPAAYAHVYRQVRSALRANTDAYLLVGPMSPGTTVDPARWIDGVPYLKTVLDHLHPLEVDAIAIHAYGGEAGIPAGGGRPIDHFVAQIQRQVEAAAESGYVSTPLFLTEMNQFSSPAQPQFLTDALHWIDAHNRQSPQDIVAAIWFVYHDQTGEWRHLALENEPDMLAALRAGMTLPPGR